MALSRLCLKILRAFFGTNPLKPWALAAAQSPINTAAVRQAELKRDCRFSIVLSGYGRCCQWCGAGVVCYVWRRVG